MYIKALKCLLIINLIHSLCYGQGFVFKSYTSAQGLSQNSGYCIAQDGKGFIWMGTQDGLDKFNGTKIVKYYKETVTKGSLSDNFIKALYYDSIHSQLWIGTANGLNIYDVLTDSFYKASHFIKNADTLNGLMIRSIIEGRNADEVIVVTASEGLFVCNGKKAVQYFNNFPQKNSTSAAAVWNNQIVAVVNKQLYTLYPDTRLLLNDFIFEDVRKLLVWQNELWSASTVNGTIRVTDLHDPKISLFDCGSKNIGALEIDNAGNLWIGTRDIGLVIISAKSLNTVAAFTAADNQSEWPGKFTLSILKDRQGNMWTGTSGGGFALRVNANSPFNLIRKSEIKPGKIAHNMILALYKPGNNLLYSGTQLEGLRSFNLQTGKTESLTNTVNSLANSVYSITASSPNDLWLATVEGLYNYKISEQKFIHHIDNNFPQSTAGQFVYKLRNADSLLYSSNHGSVFFDLKNKRFSRFNYTTSPQKLLNIVVNQVVEDGNGNLWLSTSGYGLIKYNLQNQMLTVIEKVLKLTYRVNAAYYENNQFFLASNSGLLIYNTINDSLTKVINSASGLQGNVLYSIEKDKNNNFWCGTNSGLAKIDITQGKITQVKASAGLQSDEFNTSCSTRDYAGNLYFGGINGISFFNPEKFLIDPFSPAPFIESITIFNQEIPSAQNIIYTDYLQLTHTQNFITLEFGVTNFVNHDECVYKYQLEGSDKDWVFSGSRNYTNYSDLHPGKYIFKLQSCNSSGVWNKKVVTLTIVINPAWWQTWWFIIFSVLLTVGIIAWAVKKRISNIRLKSELKQKITETEMAALKAQMNPHFMFNCINSIDSFIQTNDKYNATLYLNKFAKLIRNVLDSSKQNVVPFSKDIETLKLYIELEELRSDNKFKTNLNIDEDLMSDDFKVPPLIMQPFVENAIIHGLKNREDNTGLLNIGIQKENNSIHYVITDNGIGRLAASKIIQNKDTHFGMQMSYDRIKLFNKEVNPSVVITDLYDGPQATGTKIDFYLNIV